MQNDPIVEEVRQIRHKIEAECNHDSHTLFLRALEIQKECAQYLTKDNVFIFKKDINLKKAA